MSDLTLEFFESGIKVNKQFMISLIEGELSINWRLVNYCAYELDTLTAQQINEIKRGKPLASSQTFYLKTLALAINAARNYGHQCHLDIDKAERNWVLTQQRASKGDMFNISLVEDDEDTTQAVQYNEDFVFCEGKKLCLSISLQWHAIIYTLLTGYTYNALLEDKINHLVSCALILARSIGLEEGEFQ